MSNAFNQSIYAEFQLVASSLNALYQQTDAMIQQIKYYEDRLEQLGQLIDFTETLEEDFRCESVW